MSCCIWISFFSYLHYLLSKANMSSSSPAGWAGLVTGGWAVSSQHRVLVLWRCCCLCHRLRPGKTSSFNVIPQITSFKSHQDPPLLFVLFSTFSERLYKLRNISTGGFSSIFCLPQTPSSCCRTGVGFPRCNSMCTSLIRFQASTVALLLGGEKFVSVVTSCAKQPQIF